MILKSIKQFSVRGLALSSVAFAGAIAMGCPAFAQTQTAPADEADASGVKDIVVTAQRREESLQKVPLSIVAIGRDSLDNQNVTQASRLEQIAPGLSVGRSGADPRPAIRGVITETIQGNTDPRIGFYIDEIYQSRTSQLSTPFIDLERVEVQKGPQGTLYGRNSFGGNIALATAKPNDKRVEGGVDLVVGDYRRVLGQAFINLPITSGLSVRFAAAAERRDGFIRSLANPGFADQDDTNYQYVRGALRWTPPALDGRLDVILRASFWNDDSKGANTFNAKAIGQFIDPRLITAPGGTLNVGNGTFTFPQGFNGRSFSGQFVPYSAFRDGVVDINGADIGILIPGNYLSNNDEPSFQRIKSKQFSSTINFDLTDSIRIRSITGLVDFNAVRGGDNDGTRASFGVGFFITKSKSFSQELQIQSTGDGPFQYTLGGFHFNDRVPDAFLGARTRDFSTASALAAGLPGLVFGSDYTTLPSFRQSLGIGPNGFEQFVGGSAITPNASDNFNPLSFQKTVSDALYGQASYKFGKLTATGGIRYTIETKDLRSARQNAFAAAGTFLEFLPSTDFNLTCGGFTAAGPGSTAAPATIANALITRCGKRKFKFFTYRAALDYQLGDDVLLYASYSTGKHAGGFSVAPLPGNTELPAYQTEGVEAFEIGLKGKFLDSKLLVNVAAFLNRYDSLQIQTSFANPLVANSVVSVLANGATNKSPGIDFEVVAKPARGLKLNFAANYLHSRDDEFPISAFSSGICSVVIQAGTCLTNPAVGIGFNSAFLPNPISNPELFIPILTAAGTQLVVNAVPQFQALGYGGKSRVQNTPDISLRGGIAYDIELGGDATLTPEVQTYFNGGYILSRALINFQQKSYTKTELRLTYQNGNGLSLQAFVENLENEAVIGRATVSNGGAFSGTFAAPRTYGLRLGYRF